MAFHAAREYNLITFDEATPSKDWEDGFTTTGARSSPFQDKLPLWRNSTPADAGYCTADSASGDFSAAKGLQDTLCWVERGLASVEQRMKDRDSRLYETIDDIEAKLKKLELSQAKRDDELSNMRQKLHDKQVGLRDHDASFVPSPPKAAFRCKTESSANLPAVSFATGPNGGQSSVGNGQDKLWNTLEQINQLAKDSKSEKSCPVSQKPHNPLGTKPHIRPTHYDGSSSWNDYHAQFDIVAELNGWETRTRAIYLAASLQGPARATLGDLDATKRTDYEALTEALEAHFGSQHWTEMYRAQLRCHVPGREEMLPELSQAVQRLTRQAYPAAPSSLQDTLARDHFINALPDNEMRWRIHQARPKCLREALTTAPEVEAFYVADIHRTRVQARAVLPSSIDLPISEPENDLQKQVGELRQVVNQLLTKPDQPPWRRPGSGRLPANYSGCFTCGGLDHMQCNCQKRRPMVPGNDFQPGLRAGARLPPQCKAPAP